MTLQHRVVILGAGFGGVSVARRLARARLPGLSVEIVDSRNYFVFQPLLPEVAAGSVTPSDAVTPLRLMLPKAKHREAEVLGIDFTRKRVEVVQGWQRKLVVLPYDELVIALGQEVSFARFPGLAEHAFTMRSLSDAFGLRNHVVDCLEQAEVSDDPTARRRLLTFVVIGGGLSGVETLGEMETMLSRALAYYPRLDRRDIRLVLAEMQPAILPEVAPGLATYAARLLHSRGVEILVGVGVKAAAVGSIELSDGRVIETATMVATIGAAPSKLVQALPLPKHQGRILVEPTLRVAGFSDVWAVGDVAAVPLDSGGFAPPTAQAAVQEGERLAANLLAPLAGGGSKPFHFEYRGQLASLGGRRGVAEIKGHQFHGRLAWMLWRWVYLAMLPSWATRIRVAVDWGLDWLLPRNIVQIAPPRPSGLHRQRFRRGDVVFRRGDVCGPFYLVESGSFRRKGGEMEGVIGPHGHFGEGVLQGERLRRSSVVAEEDGFCLVINPEDLRLLAASQEALRPYFEPPEGGIHQRSA
jgi:NADH dehydrogenase